MLVARCGQQTRTQQLPAGEWPLVLGSLEADVGLRWFLLSVCARPHLWDGATNLPVPHDTSSSPLCGGQPVAHLSLSFGPRLLLVTSLAAVLLQEVGSASLHQVGVGSSPPPPGHQGRRRKGTKLA